jgi:hypothetical protein
MGVSRYDVMVSKNTKLLVAPLNGTLHERYFSRLMMEAQAM